MADNILSGNSGRVQQFQRYGPQGQDALLQLLSSGLGNINNPTKGFEPIEQKARSDFANKTLPTLAERFTSMNSGLGSRSYQNALAGHGVDLEERLAAMKAMFGQQQQQFGLNQLNTGLTPSFDTYYDPEYQSPQQGAYDALLKGVGQLGTQGLYNQFGGSGAGTGDIGVQGDQKNDNSGWNWENALNTGGNIALAAAPFANLLPPPWGQLVSLLLGGVGAGAKAGSKYLAPSAGEKYPDIKPNTTFREPIKQTSQSLGYGYNPQLKQSFLPQS